jgi:hypothetical protein
MSASFGPGSTRSAPEAASRPRPSGDDPSRNQRTQTELRGHADNIGMLEMGIRRFYAEQGSRLLLEACDRYWLKHRKDAA